MSARRSYAGFWSDSRQDNELGGLVKVDIDLLEEPAALAMAIGEVEVMAPGPADVAKAQELVEAFMDAHQLASASVPLGKLLASIKALRPKHWRALVAALAHKYPQLMG